MIALVTGVEGFVGQHLASHLLSLSNTTVHGTTWQPPDQDGHLAQMGIKLQQADLTDAERVRQVVEETAPDHIYHLAAQSFVPASFENPWATLSNNIHAQLNILHTLAQAGNSETRVLVISSAQVYGAVPPEDVPLSEEQAMRPSSPYSVSKATQDLLGLQYFLSHRLHVIRVRPFNHIGPGQNKRFVASDFASQVAAIEARKQDPVIHVGNLDAQRDFTDVRDVVRAYHLLLEKGTPGEVYNIGTGHAHSIKELLDILLGLSDAPIKIRMDTTRFRPVEVPIIACDTRKLQLATGWEPQIPFERTLADTLNYWRLNMGVPFI